MAEVSAMASCMILSCPSDNAVYPIRLAGTCSSYSNRATPQLSSAATYQGLALRSLRWAYHAKVMKTFEADSSSTERSTGLEKSEFMREYEGGVSRVTARNANWDES